MNIRTMRRRKPAHRVVTLSAGSVREEVREVAEEAGLTYDEFIRRAEADELEDDSLRDFWMMARPALS